MHFLVLTKSGQSRELDRAAGAGPLLRGSATAPPARGRAEAWRPGGPAPGGSRGRPLPRPGRWSEPAVPATSRPFSSISAPRSASRGRIFICPKEE
ncbi:Greb1-Like Protein [Manis pentadactyla]|nr:Greb1-Like Protein [Manis pentadactyla]